MSSTRRGDTTVKARALTDRQERTLTAIRDYIAKHGIPPSRPELGEMLGLKYPTSVEGHLRALAKKGWIELKESQNRGIKLLREGKPVLELDEIPIVTAGNPILAEEAHDLPRLKDFAGMCEEFETTPDYFVRVRGDSMEQIGFRSGDMVAVQRNPEPEEGDVVIARIGPDVTLKRYHRAGQECIELQPESTNPEHETIRINPTTEDFEIVGVVVGAIIGTPRATGTTRTETQPNNTEDE